MSITLTTPTLETQRLILRGPRPEDVDTFIRFYGSDRARFVGGPLQERPAWYFFGTEIGHWVMRGYGMFVVTMKGDDTPLGIVGHWYPKGWPETEVGWVLFGAGSESKGIAFEAAQACIKHGWEVLGWTSMVSYIEHGNHRSVALAERLGAELDPDAAMPKIDKKCFVYRHRRPS